MLDGAARVGDLVDEVARLEMPAIAMTDHGNVFGAFDFYKQATKAGVTIKNVCNGQMVEMMTSPAAGHIHI
jgi:DNA polymerase III alpha subunit